MFQFFESMNPFSTQGRSAKSITDHAAEYTLDTFQRSILFMDILRKRGNVYLDHLKNDQPPVLVFDYDMIVDGRTLNRPANYALVKIVDRRTDAQDRRTEREVDSKTKPRRQETKGGGEDPKKRPIVIIDPRAGHGPGIGGSKQNSEIGMALNMGHPVYFVMFFTDPMPGQVLGDVKNAEIVFLEEVKRRHPGAPRATVIGNCQGGWAGALLGADRPDLVGPLVLNGSPLSYWSGVGGTNPMRYTGGLCGGVWINSFIGDLGNGLFDGANLVMNMEGLNPANTYWKKLYNVYSKVDTEEERFLNFEKWWGGFFIMTTEEIHKIVDGLFIGNELVEGKFSLEPGKAIDLKRFNDPVVVFASEGDNITPPQQALNWIPLVYKTDEEIKRHNQVIVYIVHPRIGHLGIFVATSIAKKEQKEIIGSVEMIDYLSPGLYEMVILEEPSKQWKNDYKVKFEERSRADILKYDDGLEDEEAFKHVATVSKLNDSFYKAFMRPFVTTLVTKESAEILKQNHPLRTQRYMISDLNPFMIPFASLAPYIKENRVKTDDDNPFAELEKGISDVIEKSLNAYRDVRDYGREFVFNQIFNNDYFKILFPDLKEEKLSEEEIKVEAKKQKKIKADDRSVWRGKLEEGGYPEGVIRMMIAMAGVDGSIDEAEFKVANKIMKEQKRLKNLPPETLKEISREQSRILQTDYKKAIEALPKLITTKKDRERSLKFAQQIAGADLTIDKKEAKLLEQIKGYFKL